MSLPNHFCVYKAPNSSSQAMLSTIYYLGALDAKPLFICEETISLSGHIDIIMHSYPMTDTKTICCSACGERYGYSCDITCPFSSEIDNKRDGQRSRELFRRRPGQGTWGYVSLIPYSDGHIAEMFEWRRSRSNEVSSLRNGKRTAGKKLVRLQSGSAEDSDSKRSASHPGRSSDGKEIVAVWTDDTQTWFRGAEKVVVGKFAFLGSAAASGEADLGERWKRVAVISAMYMRRVELEQKQNTSPRIAMPG
jgi:hypothetical protein